MHFSACLKNALPLVALLASALPLFSATWTGEGATNNWFDEDNWLNQAIPGGLTGSSNAANFNLTSPMTIVINGAAEAQTFLPGADTTITLEMASNSSLTTGSFFRVGNSTAPNANVTIKGPESGTGNVNINGGASNNQIAIFTDSTLRLEGSNLIVTTAGSTLFQSNNARMTITGGATLKDGGLRLGQTTAGSDDLTGNSVVVEGDSTYQIYQPSPSATLASVGNGKGHALNSILISGDDTSVTNALMDLQDGVELKIGNDTGTNAGGNHVTVGGRGDLTTNGAINIRGYTHAEGTTDHGANRLTIADGGTVTSSSTITIGHNTKTTYANALLQLEAGGTLDGTATISVHNGARFEAAGNGLGADVLTTITAGGALVVTPGTQLAPSVLTLQSTVNFETDGLLKLTLYEGGLSDSIAFVGDGLLSGNVTLELTLDGFTPEAGQTWVLFTGDTDNITASFTLTGLDPTLWDLTHFNETGGWKLQTIPEPSTVAFLLIGAGFIASRLAKRNSLR